MIQLSKMVNIIIFFGVTTSNVLFSLESDEVVKVVRPSTLLVTVVGSALIGGVGGYIGGDILISKIAGVGRSIDGISEASGIFCAFISMLCAITMGPSNVSEIVIKRTKKAFEVCKKSRCMQFAKKKESFEELIPEIKIVYNDSATPLAIFQQDCIRIKRYYDNIEKQLNDPVICHDMRVRKIKEKLLGKRNRLIVLAQKANANAEVLEQKELLERMTPIVENKKWWQLWLKY